MKNKTSGFTLIELLVVIAIIGILSSIVIASLNSARSKGKDAAIKGQLKQLQTQAEVFYDETVNGNPRGTYGVASSTGNACLAGLGINSGANSMFAAASSSAIAQQIAQVAANDAPNSATYCISTGQLWAVSISGLNGGGSHCVDNSGSFKTGSAVTAAGTCS